MITAALHLLAAALISSGAPTPHGLGADDTYTITTTLKVLRPCDPAGITDAYQDVRVLADDGKCVTLSVTYFPLDDKVRARRSQVYATKSGDLNRYLRPTVTCNWNDEMRANLLTELKQAGIEPSKLKPAEMVARVADWAFRTSSFASNGDAMPADWFVAFGGAKPQVFPPTRNAFQQAKPDPKWTDQQVFDHQLYGRQMFAARSHGACTSSSIYLATILRALGVPTRILYFIPPCDANDAAQIKMLKTAITRRATRTPVIDGVTGATGFANHMYNEVWLDGRWQRLNYNRLGQEIVDKNYLGLMTHIDTCADISETHLAETWGLRTEQWPNVSPRLSSVNPYQLLAASDHWGRGMKPDAPSATQELNRATVIGVLWPGTSEYRELIPDGREGPPTDLVIAIKEWDPDRNYIQLREFIGDADPNFVLTSPGHPDIPLRYNGLNCNNSQTRGFGMHFTDPQTKPTPGVIYTLIPINQTGTHRWAVLASLAITFPR